MGYCQRDGHLWFVPFVIVIHTKTPTHTHTHKHRQPIKVPPSIMVDYCILGVLKNLCKTILRHATNKFTAGFLRGNFFLPFLWPTRFFLLLLTFFVGGWVGKRFIFVLLYYYYGFLKSFAATLKLQLCFCDNFSNVSYKAISFESPRSIYFFPCKEISLSY